MHGRHLRNQSGEPGWQAAFGCRKNQLYEEVRKGRLIATFGNTDRKEKEPPNSPLGGSESPDGEWTPGRGARLESVRGNSMRIAVVGAGGVGGGFGAALPKPGTDVVSIARGAHC